MSTNQKDTDDTNVIRQNIPQQDPQDNIEVLPSGYGNDGAGSLTEDFQIPSCGISDCDIALFRLFDKTIKFNTQIYGGGQSPIYLQKPKVIFATGEKFALAKKLRPPRDKNQVLMLPAISIRRMTIEQTPEDMASRGMNQTTGELTIKRRLSEKDDLHFQNTINKLGLKNMSSVGSTLDENKTSKKKDVFETKEGMLLSPQLSQNVFEFFTIPQPQFFTAKYEVIFWTNHHQHMNYLIETLMSSYLPQGKMFKLGTDKGYWFMAYVDDSLTSQDNFEDFSTTERVIRYNFNITVKSFVLASNGPGNMVPVRRYISAPTLSFQIIETPTTDILSQKQLDTPPLVNLSDSRFLLSDINAKVVPQEDSGQVMLYKQTVIEPVTNKKSIKYIKQTTKNKISGERSFTASDIRTLQEFLLNESK